MLSDDKVTQLKGLIDQAESNGETPDFIQNNLIPAFKSKYDAPEQKPSSGATGSFSTSEPEATTYEQAAAPRQEALPPDASFGQKAAAGTLDALSFAGRAIASSPTFLGALHGSGGDMDYALKQFYADLGKKHSDNFVENTLRDPATVATLPLGGAGGKAAAAITKDVIAPAAGRIAAKIGVRAAAGAAESIPSAASHQLENVAEGKPFDFGKAGSEVETGAGMSAGMGTAADALSTTAKATALQTIKAYLRPGKIGDREGFNAENIFKHNLDAPTIEGMAKKTGAKLKDLNSQLDVIRDAGKSKGVTVDVPDAFLKAVKKLIPEDATESMYSQPQIIDVLTKKIIPEINRVTPEGDVAITKAMKLKTINQAQAKAAGAYNRMGDKEAKIDADVYGAFADELKNQINAKVKKHDLGDIEGVNKQFEEVLPIMQAMIRRKPTLRSNLPVSLQDAVEGTLGAATAPADAGKWEKTLRAIALIGAGKLAANPKTTKLLYNASKSKLGPTGSEVRQAIRTDLFDNIDQDSTQQGQ